MRFILLRGLGREQLHWRPLVHCLKQDFPSATIETPDLPGAGILYETPSPLSIKDYIPYLEKQLNDSPQPAVLIGLSFGGMIALAWAQQRKNLFKRIILINSSCRLNPFYHRLQLLSVMKHPGVFWRFNLSRQETAIYRLTCNQRPVDPILIKSWVAIQNQHPVSPINQLRQIIAAARFQPPDKLGNLPINILASAKDRLVNPKNSHSLAHFYQATIDYHPWAGHDLCQDDPQWISQQLFKIFQKK